MNTGQLESKPKRFTRQQERAIERLRKEADQLHQQLAHKFISFFLNADEPEGDWVQDKIKELSAKWKQYCHRNKIKPEFHNSIKDFCLKYIGEFKAEKDKA